MVQTPILKGIPIEDPSTIQLLPNQEYYSTTLVQFEDGLESSKWLTKIGALNVSYLKSIFATFRSNTRAFLSIQQRKQTLILRHGLSFSPIENWSYWLEGNRDILGCQCGPCTWLMAIWRRGRHQRSAAITTIHSTREADHRWLSCKARAGIPEEDDGTGCIDWGRQEFCPTRSTEAVARGDWYSVELARRVALKSLE